MNTMKCQLNAWVIKTVKLLGKQVDYVVLYNLRYNIIITVEPVRIDAMRILVKYGPKAKNYGSYSSR